MQSRARNVCTVPWCREGGRDAFMAGPVVALLNPPRSSERQPLRAIGARLPQLERGMDA